MKHLFILRHGEAEAFATSDEARELTPRGIEQLEAMALGYPQILQVDTVFCSPYQRTRQSLQVLFKGSEVNVVVDPHFTPDTNPDKMLDFVYRYCEQHRLSSILVVSHMPLVGRCIHALDASDQGPYFMPTAALAYLSGEVIAKDCCELHWIKHPQTP